MKRIPFSSSGNVSIGTAVVPFFHFHPEFFLKPNVRKKGTLIIEVLLGNPRPLGLGSLNLKP